MIIIKRNFKGLQFSQKWFFTEVNFLDCLKITIYKQLDFNIKSSFLFIKKNFYTLHSDLSLNENEMLKKFSATIRNEINRSEREECIFNPLDSKENFISVYNDFAAQRGIAGVTMNKLSRCTPSTSPKWPLRGQKFQP